MWHVVNKFEYVSPFCVRILENYSHDPNKRTGTFILFDIFCHPVRTLLETVRLLNFRFQAAVFFKLEDGEK